MGDLQLRLLHRLGDVAPARTTAELADLFDTPVVRHGSMTYIELAC